MSCEPVPARIVSRREIQVSPWVRVVSKEVEFAPARPPEVYHCMSQADYVAVLARTRSGLIPIVRQYRPAVEAYTLELPGGLLEKDESPEAACRRELKEEAGLAAEAVTSLGSYYADTGRLENRLFAFLANTSVPNSEFRPEPGIEVRFFSYDDLRSLIANGEFIHGLHLAVLTVHHLRLMRQD